MTHEALYKLYDWEKLREELRLANYQIATQREYINKLLNIINGYRDDLGKDPICSCLKPNCDCNGT